MYSARFPEINRDKTGILRAEKGENRGETLKTGREGPQVSLQPTVTCV
jgi:hypothetical protein